MKKNILIWCLVVALALETIVIFALANKNSCDAENIYRGEITVGTVDKDGNSKFVKGNKDYFEWNYGCSAPFPLGIYPMAEEDRTCISYERAVYIAKNAVDENCGAYWSLEEIYHPIVYDCVDNSVFVVNYAHTEPHTLGEIAAVVMNKYTDTILYCGTL